MREASDDADEPPRTCATSEGAVCEMGCVCFALSCQKYMPGNAARENTAGAVRAWRNEGNPIC